MKSVFLNLISLKILLLWLDFSQVKRELSNLFAVNAEIYVVFAKFLKLEPLQIEDNVDDR